jgi:hypothetical protein
MEYTELSADHLVIIGLQQLQQAQDAHRVALFGGELRINDPEQPASISGGAARVHADFLAASALAHFAAALAMPADFDDEGNEGEDDEGEDDDESDESQD